MKRLLAIAGAAVLAAGGALAEEFPDRELTILVNYGAGGSVDRTARSVQPFLPDALGQGVVVQNIGGAGGRVGLAEYMETEPDGYTILAAFAPATTYVKHTTPGLFEMDDLAVINVQWVDPAILLAHEDTGWTSLQDMIDDVRANPGEYAFGSSGRGSVGPVLTRALFDALGLEVKSVPYRGGGATRRAFASGEVDLTAAGAGGALSVKDASVPLAVFWPDRIDSWPEAPPVNEALEGTGVEAPLGGAYRFFAVHSALKENHPERFETLVEAFRQVVEENEAFRAAAQEGGVGTMWTGPEEGQALIEEVDQRFSELLAAEDEG